MAKWAADKKIKIVGRPVDAIFPERRVAMAQKKCMPAPLGCGKPIESFRDALSEREYGISGFCQQCQDDVFGAPSTQRSAT